MIDYDLYNERREELINCFADDITDFIGILEPSIEDLIDLLEWEDNPKLARLMGWDIESDE